MPTNTILASLPLTEPITPLSTLLTEAANAIEAPHKSPTAIIGPASPRDCSPSQPAASTASPP
ncbi:hypothetical protein ACWIG3_35985 [Streptomyces celluloflavus]|uniref:Uncharacterized protein n=1 Tax=Streptomyces celluloflavus TaxID=58344 RepID=A0ABW7RI72_9ACTN|nr:hypothetical protein [Streptomyces kasugaensis]